MNSDIQKQIAENGPNGFQREAILKFWSKAKPKGWKRIGHNGIYEDGTIELIFTDRTNKHWIRFSADGECVAAPTTMITKRR